MKNVLVVGGIAVGRGAMVAAQTVKEAGRDWAYHQGDAGGTRYSTLTQISTSNVKSLKRAWTFHTGSGRFASAPMVVDSVMYFSAPNGVYAVNAVTGEQIWKYTLAGEGVPPAAPPPAGEDRGGGRGAGRGGGESIGPALRGPAYWPGAKGVAPRI